MPASWNACSGSLIRLLLLMYFFIALCPLELCQWFAVLELCIHVSYVRGVIFLMGRFLLMFTLLLNCVLPLKLLSSDFLPRISRDFTVFNVGTSFKNYNFASAHQLLMLFVETLIFLENIASLCHILLYL
jgi:hypothetical protein